jgi:L-threonylcarbamoyladenylate synthase
MSSIIFTWKIFVATRWIKLGYVIAYPTESVYGLGCDPKNLTAVQQILNIKQRSAHKGLILVASDIDQIRPYIKELSAAEIAKINTPSPRVITWLIPARDNLSHLLIGTHSEKEKKIAIRISQHPTIKALCQQLGQPIVSTSANISGQAMCYSAKQVKQQLSKGIKYILTGALGQQTRPSEIRDLKTHQLIRE